MRTHYIGPEEQLVLSPVEIMRITGLLVSLRNITEIEKQDPVFRAASEMTTGKKLLDPLRVTIKKVPFRVLVNTHGIKKCDAHDAGRWHVGRVYAGPGLIDHGLLSYRLSGTL